MREFIVSMEQSKYKCHAKIQKLPNLKSILIISVRIIIFQDVEIEGNNKEESDRQDKKYNKIEEEEVITKGKMLRKDLSEKKNQKGKKG